MVGFLWRRGCDARQHPLSTLPRTLTPRASKLIDVAFGLKTLSNVLPGDVPVRINVLLDEADLVSDQDPSDGKLIISGQDVCRRPRRWSAYAARMVGASTLNGAIRLVDGYAKLGHGAIITNDSVRGVPIGGWR